MVVKENCTCKGTDKAKVQKKRRRGKWKRGHVSMRQYENKVLQITLLRLDDEQHQHRDTKSIGEKMSLICYWLGTVHEVIMGP